MQLGDLLTISRTTKAFRELLLGPNAKRFWKLAMENSEAEGVPPCPDWLSPPAYANLLYSPHCHVSDIFSHFLSDFLTPYHRIVSQAM